MDDSRAAEINALNAENDAMHRGRMGALQLAALICALAALYRLIWETTQ